MGCGTSVPRSVQQPLQDAQTAEFDRALEEEKAESQLHFKLLCLGAGESGKSTIIKQLVFLHKQNQISDEEALAYVRVLHSNVLTSITTLLKEAADFGYELDEESREHAEIIEACDIRQPLSQLAADAVEALWTSCPAIAQTYERRSEFWLLEGASFYFDNVQRFVEDGYRPSEEDIVMARKRTTGVVETQMRYGDCNWSVVDVGGQRSERKKWFNCFSDVHGILFVVNLAGYCSVLFEDRHVNRMQESLKVFEDTMANPLFFQVLEWAMFDFLYVLHVGHSL
jgi:GTPase SAR1 family protein